MLGGIGFPPDPLQPHQNFLSVHVVMGACVSFSRLKITLPSSLHLRDKQTDRRTDEQTEKLIRCGLGNLISSSRLNTYSWLVTRLPIHQRTIGNNFFRWWQDSVFGKFCPPLQFFREFGLARSLRGLCKNKNFSSRTPARREILVRNGLSSLARNITSGPCKTLLTPNLTGTKGGLQPSKRGVESAFWVPADSYRNKGDVSCPASESKLPWGSESLSLNIE